MCPMTLQDAVEDGATVPVCVKPTPNQAKRRMLITMNYLQELMNLLEGEKPEITLARKIARPELDCGGF